jgi:fumarate hydratase class II
MAATRIEKDTFGPIEVPADRLWGAQTQRSLQNFAISGERMPAALLKALALVKKAAALVNQELGALEPTLAEAIVRACDEVVSGDHDGEFPLVVWQTGSGTQSNMNMNEVVANRASELLGGERGEKRLVHPNDHVNRGQSSNDVFPAAMALACTDAVRSRVIPAVRALRDVLAEKAKAFGDVVKIGRTHLMDATPLTLGQEISGWVAQLDQGLKHLDTTVPHLAELALGGTAVGTGLNAHPEYAVRVARRVAELSGHPIVTAPNKFESLAAHDAIVLARARGDRRRHRLCHRLSQRRALRADRDGQRPRRKRHDPARPAADHPRHHARARRRAGSGARSLFPPPA